ncbi:MAG: transposase [Bacteroidales bacterium]
MMKIQSTLKNFSVAKDISQLLANSKDLGFGLYIDERGVIYPVLPDDKCPQCLAKLSKNGYNHSQERVGKHLGLNFKKGKLVCQNKTCNFQLSTPKEIIRLFNGAFWEWFDNEIISLGTKGLSPGAIAQHLKEMSIISFSDEYIRLRLQDFAKKTQQPKPLEKPSGVIIHDEQFLKIKGNELKRISTLDAHNPNVYHDKLYSNRTKDTMEKIFQELKKTFGDTIRAAVIDGLAASKNALKEVFIKVIIQFCLFHFAKNVKDAYKEEVGYGKGKHCIPLDHLIGFFSILNIFFDHDREINELRKLQEERKEHIDRINNYDLSVAKRQDYIEDYKVRYDEKAREYLREVKKIRRRTNGIKLTLRTEEQAKELLETAKKFNVFPKKVQKQVVRLENNWENFTHCLRDKTIPPTSNKIEQFYALTLNWNDKNNLQSEEEFYQEQKFNLFKRYNLPFFKHGSFTNFIKTAFALFLTFGIT